MASVSTGKKQIAFKLSQKPKTKWKPNREISSLGKNIDFRSVYKNIDFRSVYKNIDFRSVYQQRWVEKGLR